MPNVTIFVQADKMPTEEGLAEITVQCEQLCAEVLRAARENVHIIYVAVRQGRGHPIFAEVQYRVEPFRTKPVMDAFLGKLDEVIRRNTGLTARIRCFGYAASNVYACN